MKIGCNTVAFRKMDLDYALEKISEAGYEYVEVEANLKWCSHADPWRDDPVKFKDKIKSFGFKGVSAIGSHRELITSEQGVKDIKRALEWAHEADVPVVLTGEGRIPQDMSVEDALYTLKERYKEILEVAEKYKVYLAIEDHGSISLTPNGLPKLLSLAESKWFGVNYDTANIHRGDYVGTDSDGYEWKMGTKSSYDEVELLKKVTDRVKHLHIKDVVGRNAVTLGQGEINIIGCLEVLKKSGYQGVLSYETEGFEEPVEAYGMIVESRKFLIDVLNSL
ncbi:MAG: sugar phosphate isomerase/epimerase [Actinobacteria bacterium]|nr:sugar phosphate isomerase/epimerase [Actinomycetota bacterium]